jgi:ubiquinone biosynthesis protein
MLRIYWKRWHRAKEIGQIISRNGFGSLLTPSFKETVFREKLEAEGERFRQMIRELGPVFLALGRALSDRPEFLPSYLGQQVALLEDKGPPLPFSSVRNFVSAELKRSPAEAFLSVAEEPVSASSTKLVYRGFLKTGRPLALKVQRPGIEGFIHGDMDILSRTLRLLERQTSWAGSPEAKAIFRELQERLHRELYFLDEARKGDRLRKSLTGWNAVRVPEILWDYTSHRVLATEGIFGKALTDPGVQSRPGKGEDPPGKTLLALFLHQTLNAGFFQTEPVSENFAFDDRGKLILYDFNHFDALSPSSQKNLRLLLAAILNREVDEIERILSGLAAVPTAADLRRKTTSIFDDLASAGERNLPLGKTLRRIGLIAEPLNLTEASALRKSGKAFEHLEKTVLTISPETPWREEILSFLRVSPQA